MAERVDAVLEKLEESTDETLERLFVFLRIPSVSTDPAYSPDCLRAAEWCADFLEQAGFEASVRPTGGQPMAVGHARPKREGNGPRILFYGHYDVQPPDPLDLWDNPPFEPQFLDGPDNETVIAARGASDDKGQLLTFLDACRAWHGVHGSLPLAVTVLLEGEEESGSPSLLPFLRENKSDLEADIALVCDTGQWDAATPAITTMLRGLAAIEVEISGPNRDLHSGMYGGPAINPISVLTGILSELRDQAGRIQIEGFYDGIEEPAEEQLAQWRALDFDENDFLASVGLTEPAGEADRSVLEQLWSRPTVEINGIYGGYTGPGTKTVIPATASAKLSFRLVPGQDPQKVLSQFRSFVEKKLPADCSASFKGAAGSPAVGFNTDTAPMRAAATALGEEFGKPAIFMGCGGSIPIVEAFKTELGMESMLIGFALNDDRIHSPNEKYNLSSFLHGRRAWVRILAQLAE